MIRQNSTAHETKLGTFYLTLSDPNATHGPGVYAETEDGTFTVNGITYQGMVHFVQYPWGMALDATFVRREDDFSTGLSDSARRKLEGALQEHAERVANDEGRVVDARVRLLQQEHRNRLDDARRMLDSANGTAQLLRELGHAASDVSTVTGEAY